MLSFQRFSWREILVPRSQSRTLQRQSVLREKRLRLQRALMTRRINMTAREPRTQQTTNSTLALSLSILIFELVFYSIYLIIFSFRMKPTIVTAAWHPNTIHSSTLYTLIPNRDLRELIPITVIMNSAAPTEMMSMSIKLKAPVAAHSQMPTAIRPMALSKKSTLNTFSRQNRHELPYFILLVTQFPLYNLQYLFFSARFRYRSIYSWLLADSSCRGQHTKQITYIIHPSSSSSCSPFNPLSCTKFFTFSEN